MLAHKLVSRVGNSTKQISHSQLKHHKKSICSCSRRHCCSSTAAKMQSSHLFLEEPIRMASILEPSNSTFFPSMTRIVGTLGPNSRSVDTISGCLKAGMSVARFDFSWGDAEFHQETLGNLKVAIKSTNKLCAVMLDTVGPELQVVNKSEHPISLQEDTLVVLTPDQDKEATSNLLPINFSGLAKVSF